MSLKQKKFKILYVEDSESDQFFFNDYIDNSANKDTIKNIEFELADSINSAKSLLNIKTYNLIITDYLLGDGDGFDIFEVNTNNSPIIFLTGMGDERVAVRAMKSGAMNYIIKDLESEYLDTIFEEISRLYRKWSLITKQTLEIVHTTDEISTDGLVFYLDDKGPKLLNSKENINLAYSKQNLLKMGSFFYLAIGLGNERNLGLFELPVPGYSEYTAIVYSTEVKDESYMDQRSLGLNYLLLSFVFPKNKKSILPHSTQIEKIFENIVNNYPNLSDYANNEWYTELLIKLNI